MAENFDAPGRPDAALARHLVRLHAALLVPRPHVPEHVDPGHLDLPPLQERAGSTAGRAWAAAKGPAPTSGTTPTPWPGSSPNWSATCAQRTDFGLAQIPTTGVINHPRRRRADWRWTARRAASCAPTASTRCRADDAFLQDALAEDQAGHGVPDPAWTDGDGMLEGPQHNTLDQPWFGKVAWLSSLYLAALRACEEMAHEVGDEAFAAKRAPSADAAGRTSTASCSTASTIIHDPRPEAPARASGSHDGCEIDQVFGQSWAYQVGLGRILPEEHVKTGPGLAVEVQLHARRRPLPQGPQAGPLVRHAGRGRPADVHLAPRRGRPACTQGFDYYFNECMNGFEYQVAGHMIWEGMVRGRAGRHPGHPRPLPRLAPQPLERGRVRRPLRPRPWPATASSWPPAATSTTGPKGHLGFAPRLTPERLPRRLHRGRGLGQLFPED